jgi:hypothetical protein
MHYRRTTTTTTIVEEVSLSKLTKSEQAIYDAHRSPFGNPERELLRKIAAYMHLYGMTEEEATRAVLHPHSTT